MTWFIAYCVLAYVVSPFVYARVLGAADEDFVPIECGILGIVWIASPFMLPVMALVGTVYLIGCCVHRIGMRAR